MFKTGTTLVTILFCISLLAGIAYGQDYPIKPVTFIVPYPPGGTADSSVRILGNSMTKYLGQPVIVENRTGAGGQLAADFLARSKPDGYIVGHLFYNQTHGEYFTHVRQAASTSKDFKVVAQWTSNPPGIVVRSDEPFKSLKDLIEFAKKNPGLTYGQGGRGNLFHVAMVLLSNITGIKLDDLPTKGDADSLTKMLGGHLKLAIGNMSFFGQHIKAGKLKALAIVAEQRLEDFPTVPTVKELGFNIGITDIYFAAYVSQNTPDPIVDKLRTAIKRTTQDEGFISGIKKIGLPIIYLDGKELQKKIDDITAAVVCSLS